LILHRPFKLKLRFRVPSSHQLRRILRLIQLGCNCEYLWKIVDFTKFGARMAIRFQVLPATAAKVVQN